MEGRDCMLGWLSANLINILLVAVIMAVVVLLIRGMIRDKKTGKSSCGGSCASCSACSSCSSCGRCAPAPNRAPTDPSR